MSFDIAISRERIARFWSDEILPQITEYIRIPALSPSFDADWEASGHIEKAVGQITRWIESRPVAGMSARRATPARVDPADRGRDRAVR